MSDKPQDYERNIRLLAEASRGAFEALAKADPGAAALPIIRAGIVLEAKLRRADMDTVRVPRAALQVFVGTAALLVARALRQRRLDEIAKVETATSRPSGEKRDVVIVRDRVGMELDRLDVTGMPEREIRLLVDDVQRRHAVDGPRRREPT